MFCSKCGQTIPENAKFCPSCGTPAPSPSACEASPSEDAKTVALDSEQSTYSNPYGQSFAQEGYANSNGQTYSQGEAANSYGQSYTQGEAANSYGQSYTQGTYPNPYGQSFTQGAYPNPYGQTFGQNPAQTRGSYSYNSDSFLFQNPHTGLLVFLIILGYLTAIFANCGLIKFNPYFYHWEESLYYFQFFPMCLIAAALGYAITSADFEVELYRSLAGTDINVRVFYTGLTVFFFILAALALIIFIYSCVISGRYSLRHRHPSKQLRVMNTFLVLNWIYWLLYTLLILLPDVISYKEVGEFHFLVQYSVAAFLHTGCLILMTILKPVYSKKILKAYDEYERRKAPLPPYTM